VVFRGDFSANEADANMYKNLSGKVGQPNME